MEKRPIWKTIVIYAACFIFLVVLIEATWGLSAGVLIGSSMGTDKATQDEIARVLKERGIQEPDASHSDDGDWYSKLPADVKKDIENIVNRKLKVINWFEVTLVVSAFTFGLVSFICGFVNRAFLPIGIIILLSLLVDNPIVRFPHAKALGLDQKVLIVLAQFVVCYVFSYFGALLGKKRDKKRLEHSVIGS